MFRALVAPFFKKRKLHKRKKIMKCPRRDLQQTFFLFEKKKALAKKKTCLKL
jgi:hypothetical protein